MKNNMFWGALGLSVAIHATFFVLVSMPQSPLKPPPIKKPLEVAYQETTNTAKPAVPPQDYTKLETQRSKLPSLKDAKPDDAIMKQQRELIRKDIFKDAIALDVEKKPIGKSEEASFKKTVNLPSIPGEVFKSQEYKSYYQIIREKIRKFAYFNYKRLDEGEVFLTFSLTHEGELVDLSVNNQKSTDNEYLRSIAEQSVKDAAPYPPFPEKLKENKKLSFNVIISFELK
ncbi:MAG: hypothetical protein HZB36_02190 [Candidatus Omnitrophica bacterium]|nr:hypothetical protein [Candidatus Omnitrophota bacterium]